MTTRISEIPIDQAAAASARHWFAVRVLGFGLFVSAYVHGVAVPGTNCILSLESVGLFPTRQDRAAIELALSMPSRASAGSAEASVRAPQRPPAKERVALERAFQEVPASLDDVTASPVSISRNVTATSSAPPETIESPETLKTVETPVSHAAAEVAPTPLRRRPSSESIVEHVAIRQASVDSIARAATADSPSQRPSQIRLGAEADILPAHFENPPPVYPPEALRAGIEGKVIVRTKISRTGEVLSASLHESSGHPVLDRAAEEAVRRWRFRPALRFGLAVEREVGVPVVFDIREALAAQEAADESARSAPRRVPSPAPTSDLGRR